MSVIPLIKVIRRSISKLSAASDRLREATSAPLEQPVSSSAVAARAVAIVFTEAISCSFQKMGKYIPACTGLVYGEELFVRYAGRLTPACAGLVR